ncbi:hypothetical protein AMJ80_07185 [bacterium SM23_31]|nr:MAG: hypothetical protein AMJ80_07185 [bacterium SM23_31]
MEIIGKPHTRVEALDILTGKAKYTGDVMLPGMLYSRLLRSSKARAKITNVDVGKAEEMPGVKAVYVLPKEQVNYQGDIIAAVAAETEDIAEDAMRAIEVDYEELNHVVNVDMAMRSNATQIREGGNLSRPRTSERGSVEEGFSQADKIVEAEYSTQFELHQPLETHGQMVHWKDDEILYYKTTQGVQSARDAIVRELRREYPDENISSNNVRVVTNFFGGGFGSKLGANNFVAVTARLSKITNAPVKMILNRYEESLDTGNRPNSVQKYKIGVKNDGTLTAIELEAHGSGGISSGNDNLTTPTNEMYTCPNTRTTVGSVYINAGNKKPTRAPGYPQAFFGFECLMDEAADAIGMDPLELRKKNYADKSAGGTGRPYTSNGLMQCYEIGAEKIGWSRRNKTPGSDSGVKKRGMGMADLQWGGGGYAGAVIEVDIFKDGTVNVRNGSQDIGTGTKTIMAQVAAEELGLEIKDINVQIGDSNFPPGIQSGGSNTAASVCPAVRNGALEALRKLYPIVASRFNVDPEELESVKGRIQVKDKENIGMYFKEAAALMPENKVMGEGRRAPNPREYAGATFGVHFCEVEVDTETGLVKVLKAAAVHDSGRIINPLTAHNQVVGGVNQAVDYALTAERIMDNYTGCVTNPNLLDYKVITAMDVPEIDVFFVDIVDPYWNNLGMKGLGEPPRIALAAAVANAIYNATGVRFRDIPITPDKILEGLAARKEGGS